MKKFLQASAVCLTLLSGSVFTANAEKLVILTTNDTHSQLDPDNDGMGGVMRRKVLIDSIRRVEKNVVLIDAGDAVQGTLFFNLGGGRIEEEVMNALGYDFRILGNHEFDNGSDSLAKIIKVADAQFLSTNYDMEASALAPYFKKYAIKTFGDKRIGFLGINLSPKGMIAEGNYNGIVYRDAIKTANAAAKYLKEVEGVEYVVAISHIGYSPSEPPGDTMIAAESKDIDLIIGGHTHTIVDPSDKESKFPSRITNADGREILVTQTGGKGKYLGQIDIDLDNLNSEYKLIPVDVRLDKEYIPAIAAIIDPYRKGIDSLMNLKIGETAIDLEQRGYPLLNFVSDFILYRGSSMADKVDLAIINKYGLRRSIPKGPITEGTIISMLPFNNYTVVLDIKGKDLLDAFDVMAVIGGNGVSKGVDIVFDPETDKCISAKINGKAVDPEKTYRLATIDYLANGGDYMMPLRRGQQVARSANVLYKDLVNHFRTDLRGKIINPSGEVRMRPVK